MKIKHLITGLMLTLPLLAQASAPSAGSPATTPEVLEKELASLPVPNIINGMKLHQQKFCDSCHGANGIAPTANWPHISGQPFKVTAKALLDYRAGRRTGGNQATLMTVVAEKLTNQEIADLSAIYDRMPGPNGKQISVGKYNMPNTSSMDVSALITKGDPSRAITPCAACHGTTGKGRANGHVPILHGQNPVYLAAQLRDYRDGKRTGDVLKEMRFFAQKLTDDEINALANFYADQKGAPSKMKQPKK